MDSEVIGLHRMFSRACRGRGKQKGHEDCLWRHLPLTIHHTYATDQSYMISKRVKCHCCF
jgi:hypothetical protein